MGKPISSKVLKQMRVDDTVKSLAVVYKSDNGFFSTVSNLFNYYSQDEGHVSCTSDLNLAWHSNISFCLWFHSAQQNYEQYLAVLADEGNDS